MNNIDQCGKRKLKSLITSNLGRAHDEPTVTMAEKIVRKILDGELDLGRGLNVQSRIRNRKRESICNTIDTKRYK